MSELNENKMEDSESESLEIARPVYDKAIKVANIFGLLFSLLFNFFGISGVLMQNTIANISKTYESLLTPPDWAFSIWGVIYSYLIVFLIAQFISTKKCNIESSVAKIGSLFLISCIANSLWICMFVIGTPLSIFFSNIPIFTLLALLATISYKCKFFDYTHNISTILCVDMPFSIYLGWLIIASSVSIATTETAYNSTFFQQTDNICIVCSILFLIFTLLLIFKKNIGSFLVFIYTSIALCIKYYNLSLAPLGLLLVIFIFACIIFFIIFINIYVINHETIQTFIKKNQKKYPITVSLIDPVENNEEDNLSEEEDFINPTPCMQI